MVEPCVFEFAGVFFVAIFGEGIKWKGWACGFSSGGGGSLDGRFEDGCGEWAMWGVIEFRFSFASSSSRVLQFSWFGGREAEASDWVIGVCLPDLFVDEGGHVVGDDMVSGNS